MERLLGRINRPIIGWIAASLGVFWKGTEIAHNAEYLRSIILEHFDAQAFAGFVFGHPSLAIVLVASIWIVYSKRQEQNQEQRVAAGGIQVRPPEPVTKATFPDRMPLLKPGPIVESPSAVGFDEIVVRERVVEREIVYRRNTGSAEPRV